MEQSENIIDHPSFPRLKLTDISHYYVSTEVIKEVSLQVNTNETLVILGNSGCGKTTLLKIAAGNLAPTHGTVSIDGLDLSTLPPQRRRVVYLDQEALLFEHLNVEENIGFSLKLRGLASTAIRERTAQMLESIGLTDHRRKRSWELSGGQKQRVAFARAILAEPKVLLLDEPFGALDSRTRQEMQALYKALAIQYRFTAMVVTHDIREALVLGNRFATMAQGTLDCFADVESFAQCESTGVKEEIRFWKSIHSKHG